MGPARFPVVGAVARRRTDGILGEIYATDPPHNLLSVRWPTVPGAYEREECTPDQFNRAWELTGVEVKPPRETHVALVLIACLVLLFMGGVMVHDLNTGYLGYDPDRPLPTNTAGILNNAQALDAHYGLQAAERCSAGADDYIRSITSHRFHWEQSETLVPRFSQFRPTVSSPGVLTMITTRASVSNGFGIFNPITVYCNYDTQSEEVLSYASEGLNNQ